MAADIFVVITFQTTQDSTSLCQNLYYLRVVPAMNQHKSGSFWQTRLRRKVQSCPPAGEEQIKHLCLEMLCNKRLVWLFEPFETRSRRTLQYEEILNEDNLRQRAALSMCSHLCEVGGDFTQSHSSYSAASVYITELALPVLMWSCALTELSRKNQTSITPDEKGLRRELRKPLSQSNLCKTAGRFLDQTWHSSINQQE